MLNKFIAFTILTTACATAATAQSAPSAPADRQIRRMILTAPFEGSYMGVQTEDISKENFSKYGLSTVRGVGVDKVVENSPAAKGGLQKGDVILKFEGEEVGSVRKLTRMIVETAPDHTVKLIVSRNGSEREISVTLGKREMPQFNGGVFNGGEFNMETLPNLQTMPTLPRTMTVPFPPSANGSGNVLIFRGNSRQIGVSVTALTEQLGNYFGVAEGKGLLVNTVRENSPAAKAGLKAGDVIVEVDGKAVNEMAELISAVNEKKEGNVALTFIRDRNRQTVSLTPETNKNFKANGEEFEKLFGDAPEKNSDN